MSCHNCAEHPKGKVFSAIRVHRAAGADQSGTLLRKQPS